MWARWSLRGSNQVAQGVSKATAAWCHSMAGHQGCLQLTGQRTSKANCL